MYYYYTAAITILVQDLNLDVHEAIEKLRIPEDIRHEVIKTYTGVTRRELLRTSPSQEGEATKKQQSSLLK